MYDMSCPGVAAYVQRNKMNCLLYLILILLTISRVRSVCPDQCVCNITYVECYKTLPSFIPEHVTGVTAHNVPIEPYMNFTYTNWHNVTYLSLSLGNASQTKYWNRKLQDYEFTGLMNLEHLKIICDRLLTVNDSAFYGLTNVRVLDLSSNKVRYSLNNDIVAGLKGENILPNISELYLSNIIDWYYPKSSFFLYLDTLHTAMKNKPLKVLDLSGTNIYFFISHFRHLPLQLLPQLHALNISRAGEAVFSLSNIYQFYTQSPEAVFSNLQVLDASYPNFPLSESECDTLVYNIYWQFCKDGRFNPNFFPSNLTELYIKNIFRSSIPELRGTHNSTHICITFILFSSNRTICITGHYTHLQKLVISDNSFTYIQPQLIHPFTALRYLDVSNNKLGQALADDDYARQLFHALQRIEVLLLSNNSITFLQRKTLKYNKNLRIFDLSHNGLTTVDFGINYLGELRLLDLSNNILTSVHFGLNHLSKLRILDLSHSGLTSLDLSINNRVSLELLDLSYNKIVSVDCELLKSLHFSSNTPNTSRAQNDEQAGIISEGNPFSCSCENLCLFNILQDQNKTFTCFLNGNVENVDFLFLKQLDYDCNKGIVIGVFSAMGVFIIIVTAGMVPFLVKTWKKKKAIEMQERLVERGIERQAEGEYEHVAFLSFSSDDHDFVLHNVFPRLDEGLKGILRAETRCVATSDHDMRPGHPISHEIIRCLEKSTVIIFFVTRSFCKHPWCEFEFDTAIQINKPVILMLFDNVKKRHMPAVLRTHFETYIRVHWSIQNGVPVMTPGWDVLCKTIVRLIAAHPRPATEADSGSDDDDNGDNNSVGVAAAAVGGRDVAKRKRKKDDDDAKAGGSGCGKRNGDAAKAGGSGCGKRNGNDAAKAAGKGCGKRSGCGKRNGDDGKAGGSGCGKRNGDDAAKAGGSGCGKRNGDDAAKAGGSGCSKRNGDDDAKAGGSGCGKRNGDDAAKAGGSGCAKRNGDDAAKAGGSGCGKRNGEDAAKADGRGCGKRNGDDAAKAGGSGCAKTNGDDAAKAGGSGCAKTNGDDAAKAGGSGCAKRNGDDAAKAGGSGCAKRNGDGAAKAVGSAGAVADDNNADGAERCCVGGNDAANNIGHDKRNGGDTDAQDSGSGGGVVDKNDADSVDSCCEGGYDIGGDNGMANYGGDKDADGKDCVVGNEDGGGSADIC